MAEGQTTTAPPDPSNPPLGVEDHPELKAVIDDIVKGVPSASIQNRWSNFIEGMAKEGLPIEAKALVQAVLRESYAQSIEYLRISAEKVQYFNALKKGMREEIIKARTEWTYHTGKSDLDEIDHYEGKDFHFSPNGVLVGENSQPSQDLVDTKGKLEAYIKGLEEKLSSVGDDAQLANVDLENTLQKQQQTLQNMTNISKMLYDTIMAVVRKSKIGG